MQATHTAPEPREGVLERVSARSGVFSATVVFTFLATVVVLDTFGLLPEVVVAATTEEVAQPTTALAPQIELPTRIEIPSLEKAVSIANPTSTVIEDLDKELKHGAVRYPTSAKLGERGNVVLFGHSSYLPVVGNEAYRTFNGIQKLVAGDEILVLSDTRVYVYRVRTVEKKNAEDDGIPLFADTKVLTLSTCNSFGEKSDRFVVTADFVESRALSS